MCMEIVAHTKLDDKFPLQRFGTICRIGADPFTMQSAPWSMYKCHVLNAHSAKQMEFP
jgi:hypothetical protein